MTPLSDGEERLQKYARINNPTEIGAAVEQPPNKIDSFGSGRSARDIWPNDWEEVLDRMAAYAFSGHRRYDALRDELVSTHQAEPLPMGVSMSQDTITEATNKSRDGFNPSPVSRIVKA